MTAGTGAFAFETFHTINGSGQHLRTVRERSRQNRVGGTEQRGERRSERGGDVHRSAVIAEQQARTADRLHEFRDAGQPDQIQRRCFERAAQTLPERFFRGRTENHK